MQDIIIYSAELLEKHKIYNRDCIYRDT